MLFVAAALWFSLYVPYGAEILLLNPYRQDPLNTFFRAMTLMGEVWAYVLFGLAALLIRFRYTLLITLTGLLSTLVSQVLKMQCFTPRPLTQMQIWGLDYDLVSVPGEPLLAGYNSFPSGHSMAAFALYSLLALITGRTLPLLGLLFSWTAILVGISRIFLAQHFLADVLGALVFGLLISDLVWQVDRRFWSKAGFLDRRLNFNAP